MYTATLKNQKTGETIATVTYKTFHNAFVKGGKKLLKIAEARADYNDLITIVAQVSQEEK